VVDNSDKAEVMTIFDKALAFSTPSVDKMRFTHMHLNFRGAYTIL
jgi:hypothetical protein